MAVAAALTWLTRVAAATPSTATVSDAVETPVVTLPRSCHRVRIVPSDPYASW
jgi:hypothetical protein